MADSDFGAFLLQLVTAKTLVGAVVIRRLDWGWRVYFSDGSFLHSCWQEALALAACWEEASVPYYVDLSIGLLKCSRDIVAFFFKREQFLS